MKIIVLGGIGRNERENRDNMRVFSRGGVRSDFESAYSNRQDYGGQKMEKKIKVIGSLNPEKEVQDRVRVLARGGCVKACERQITKTRQR